MRGTQPYTQAVHNILRTVRARETGKRCLVLEVGILTRRRLASFFVVMVMSALTAAQAQAQASELASPWRTPSQVYVAQPAQPAVTAETPAAQLEVPPPPSGAYTGRVSLAGTPDNARLRIGSTISTRLRSLDADLQVLAARGGGGIVDGVLAIAMGAASIGIGVYMDVAGAGSSSIGPYLYVYGAAGILRGVLDFIFMPNPSAASIQYTHMPMHTMADVRARLRYGEHELESLASTAEIARILDGTISIATGLAVVPVYLGPNNWELRSPFDYFVLIGAAVSVITGSITLFTNTEAERRWGAYRELRDRLAASEQGAEDEAQLEAAREDLAAFNRARFDQVMPQVGATGEGAFVGVSGVF